MSVTLTIKSLRDNFLFCLHKAISNSFNLIYVHFKTRHKIKYKSLLVSFHSSYVPSFQLESTRKKKHFYVFFLPDIINYFIIITLITKASTSKN